VTGGGFEALIGLEVLEATPERVVGRLAVHDGARQPMGLVHGGVLAAIAETLAADGTEAQVAVQGAIGVGLQNHTNFLRPVVDSAHVHATATRRHGGRTTQVWDVDLTDDAGRLCAVSRVVIAVRPAPEAAPPAS
jgi:uncharacterized protein (TIGR00369 family)